MNRGPVPLTTASRVARRDVAKALLAAPGDGVDTTMFHSVDTVGDRWTALLVASLFFGLKRYDDINSALGIATNILADRLRRLVAAGVVEHTCIRTTRRVTNIRHQEGLGPLSVHGRAARLGHPLGTIAARPGPQAAPPAV